MPNEISQIIRCVEEMKDDLLNEASNPCIKIPGNEKMIELTTKITKILPPLVHMNGTMGKPDLLHYRFAEALRDILFISDIPEQKQYVNSDKWSRIVKESIDYVFHFGRMDAPDRERRTASITDM